MPYSPFVTTSGHRLYRQGEPYRFLGVNLFSAMHMGADGDDCGQCDRPRLIRELDRLQRLGVRNVRALASSEGPDTESWFARTREDGLGFADLLSMGKRPTPWRVLPSMQPSPGEYNPSLVRGLDFFIQQIALRNMTCVLMLGNMWPWSGGFAQYVSWADESSIPYMPPEPEGDWDRLQQYTSRFYAEPTAQSHFVAHARFVLKRVNSYTGIRYADDPAIMAWELANEPRPMRQVSSYKGWIDRVTGIVRELAPHQLITIGTEGRTPFPKSYVGIDFYNDHDHPRIDYATVHVWPQNWEWYSPGDPNGTYASALNKSLEYVRAHVDMAQQLNKPLVLEEFGLARDNAVHEVSGSVTWRDTYFSEMFAETLRHAEANSPLAGANVWAWGGEGRPRRPRKPDEPLLGSHCWQVGDPLLGDPPHEAAGWYSIFDVDHTTHAAMANLSAALARLPVDR